MSSKDMASSQDAHPSSASIDSASSSLQSPSSVKTEASASSSAAAAAAAAPAAEIPCAQANAIAAALGDAASYLESRYASTKDSADVENATDDCAAGSAECSKSMGQDGKIIECFEGDDALVKDLLKTTVHKGNKASLGGDSMEALLSSIACGDREKLGWAYRLYAMHKRPFLSKDALSSLKHEAMFFIALASSQARIAGVKENRIVALAERLALAVESLEDAERITHMRFIIARAYTELVAAHKGIGTSARTRKQADEAVSASNGTATDAKSPSSASDSGSESSGVIAAVESSAQGAAGEVTAVAAAASVADAKVPKMIKVATDFIDGHIYDDIFVANIAEAVGCSSEHLSRLFKKHCGFTLMDYVTKERIRIAKHMLLESKCKVREIGEVLRFSSVAHFCHVFREVDGSTPSEWREAHLSSDSSLKE